MATKKQKDEVGPVNSTGEFTVTIYGDDARQISEYLIQGSKDEEITMEEAEFKARLNLKNCSFPPLVVVVSEEGPESLNQVHLRICSSNSEVA